MLSPDIIFIGFSLFFYLNKEKHFYSSIKCIYQDIVNKKRSDIENQ